MEQHQAQKETSKQSEKDEFNNDDSKHDSDDKKALLTARTKTLINHYQLTQHIATIK